jgi:hypothetical protein
MAAPERRVEASESNRTLIIGVAVVAAIVIAAVFYVLMRAGGGGNATDDRLQGAIRAGSPQFEEYKARIVLDAPEASQANRALGDIWMSLTTVVRNFTGKTLNGLEIRATVVDYEGKPVKERTAVVIPTRMAELPPNKTLPVNITLDGMKDTDARANIKMEVVGFKFKE